VVNQCFQDAILRVWPVRHLPGLLLALVLAFQAGEARGQFRLLNQDRPALGLKTLGGRIHWTDHLVWSGWRIQQYEQDGNCRLLDPNDRRIAVGSFDYCVSELCKRRRSGEIADSKKHVVVLLHGLAGTRNYMEPMAQFLREHGYDVVSIGYASTKATIQDLSRSLENVVRNLQGIEQVSIVAHSMGCILVRNMLYRIQHCRDPSPINVNFCRMVMISPPNQGAYLADTIGQLKLVQAVFGPSVEQFSPSKGWPALEAELTVPWFEFGIIAGGTGTQRGYLGCIPGDDDGLLAIDSHYLEGAADFIQVGGLHQLMPRYQAVQDSTLHFLQYGHFPR
jgi:pimeloyl-ACP methyl ester carboxylesterase